MFCKFSNFICQIYLNMFWGKYNLFYSILFGIFEKNINWMKQKKNSELIKLIILLFKYYK